MTACDAFALVLPEMSNAVSTATLTTQSSIDVHSVKSSLIFSTSPVDSPKVTFTESTSADVTSVLDPSLIDTVGLTSALVRVIPESFDVASITGSPKVTVIVSPSISISTRETSGGVISLTTAVFSAVLVVS